MLIAHLSDFHVFADSPETSLVRRDAPEAARKVVADLAAFTPAVDAVMLTGDLTDCGTAEDYELLEDILAPLKVPIFVVPGNHDRRETMRAAFRSRLPFPATGFLNYEAEFAGLRIIALDTLIEGRVEGRLASESLDWFEDALRHASGMRTIVLLHHPPFPSGITGLDEMALGEGAERFAEIVASCAGKLSILAGHIHRPYQAFWNGAFCAVAGSPAFQVALDLRPGAPEPGTVAEPYSYFIHRLSETGVAVHRRFVSL
ncbi:metallophosphoesterase [Martelella sp. FLE1502]